MRSAPTLSSFDSRLITLLVATAVYHIKFETIHSYFALHFILPFDFIQFRLLFCLIFYFTLFYIPFLCLLFHLVLLCCVFMSYVAHFDLACC